MFAKVDVFCLKSSSTSSFFVGRKALHRFTYSSTGPTGKHTPPLAKAAYGSVISSFLPDGRLHALYIIILASDSYPSFLDQKSQASILVLRESFVVSMTLMPFSSAICRRE